MNCQSAEKLLARSGPPAGVLAFGSYFQPFIDGAELYAQNRVSTCFLTYAFMYVGGQNMVKRCFSPGKCCRTKDVFSL